MSRSTRLVVDSLISAMRKRPDSFVFDNYTVKDTDNNYEYWIANGHWFYGVYRPFNMSFGLYQGWRFSVALKKLQAVQALKILEASK